MPDNHRLKQDIQIPERKQYGENPVLPKEESLGKLSNDELLSLANKALANRDPERVFEITNLIKRRHLKVKNVDLLRGLAFAGKNMAYAAREAVKEELRHFPDNKEAKSILEKFGGGEVIRASLSDKGDSEFEKFLSTVRPFTRISSERAKSLYDLALLACKEDIPGDFVECGVAAGGSTMLLALVVKAHSRRPRKVYAFDTFEGMPDPGIEDTANGVPADETGWGTGTCAAPEDFILENCRGVGVENIVETRKGLFEETLPDFKKEVGPIAFLHMDGDWYSSTWAILDNLFDVLHGDAIIQIDDYGAWDGCKKAIDEYASKKSLVLDLKEIDDTGRWLRNPLIKRPAKHDPFVNLQMVPDFADLYTVRSSILKSIQANRRLFKGSFLDVGCGIMPYKQLLLAPPSKITRYIGLDIETEIYKADVDLRWDGKSIPLEDNSIDSAMATEVLEHCPEPEIVLGEIRRVLKPDGVFFFTVPFLWPLHDAPYDFYRYTPFSLELLLKKAGFRNVSIKAMGGWNASLAQMIGLWLKRSPMTRENRGKMAEFLWPLFKKLSETDQLPDNPLAGNTMTVGWSGTAYVPSEIKPQTTPQITRLPVLIVRSHEHNYSETFIEDHEKYLSSNAAVLFGYPFPRYLKGGGRILSESTESDVCLANKKGLVLGGGLWDRYVQELAAFLKQSQYRVVLAESGLMGSFVYQACKLAGVPFVVHFHGADAFVVNILQNWQHHYRGAFQSASKIIAVSKAMQEQLCELGAPAEKTVLAPYGVSTELVAEAKPEEAPPQFLAVGRFTEKKSPHLTLQALAIVLKSVPEARLVMVGDGPLLEPCKKWASDHGIEKAVTFAGVHSRRSVSRLMSTSRAFVQHSVRATNGDCEGLPLAILEAGAHGLPVVSTRHAGIPDAVQSGKHGFLVEEGDVKGMAEAMIGICRDARRAGKMGKAFRQQIKDAYSREKSMRRLQGILQEAAEGKMATQEETPAIHKTGPEAGTTGIHEGKSEIDGLVKKIRKDRNYGPAYLKYGELLVHAGEYEDAYLVFKEAQRIGQLSAGNRSLLEQMEDHPELDTDLVRAYRERIGYRGFGISSHPRRILVFTNLLPPQEMGGYGRTVWEFCDGLLQRGHELCILAADVPSLHKDPEPGYERVEKHVRRSLKLFGDWENGKATVTGNEDRIKKIMVHNAREISRAAKAFRPDVCMVGNLDFIGNPSLDALLEMKIPALHRLGNALPGYPNEATPRTPLYAIAGCSNWINEQLREKEYEAKTFYVLHPGSPLNEYYRLFPPGYDSLRICFAGLIMAYKGPQVLVRALGILRKIGIPFRCELAGDTRDPEFLMSLKALILSEGIEDSVKLLGFCSRRQLAALYARSNVMVFPSVFEEPFGKSRIEAQAAGLAVVSSDTGGYKDIVTDGENGLVFKNQDAEDLARQLYILQGDPKMWQRLASKGQQDAFRFDTSRSVEKLESLFEDLLRKNS